MPAGTWANTTEPPVDSTQADTVSITVASPTDLTIDTLLFEPERDVSVARRVTNTANLEKTLSQRPMVALTKSLLGPGLGQLGNHRFTKALVFAGLETWFIASVVHYGGQASDAYDYYQSSVDREARIDGFYLYDNKRKNRNKFAWYAGLTIFISIFDANVYEHLSGSPADSLI